MPLWQSTSVCVEEIPPHSRKGIFLVLSPVSCRGQVRISLFLRMEEASLPMTLTLTEPVVDASLFSNVIV